MSHKKEYEAKGLKFVVEIDENPIEHYPILKIYKKEDMKSLEKKRKWKKVGEFIHSDNPNYDEVQIKITWEKEIKELEKAIKYFRSLAKQFTWDVTGVNDE